MTVWLSPLPPLHSLGRGGCFHIIFIFAVSSLQSSPAPPSPGEPFMGSVGISGSRLVGRSVRLGDRWCWNSRTRQLLACSRGATPAGRWRGGSFPHMDKDKFPRTRWFAVRQHALLWPASNVFALCRCMLVCTLEVLLRCKKLLEMYPCNSTAIPRPILYFFIVLTLLVDVLCVDKSLEIRRPSSAQHGGLPPKTLNSA